MTITVSWQQQLQFSSTTADGHELLLDADSKVAPCPTEALLSALGSCSATDVVLGLQEQGAELLSLTNQVSYTLTNDEPRLYNTANLHFSIGALNLHDIDVDQVIADAIAKYCHVCLMMSKSIVFSHSYSLIEK